MKSKDYYSNLIRTCIFSNYKNNCKKINAVTNYRLIALGTKYYQQLQNWNSLFTSLARLNIDDFESDKSVQNKGYKAGISYAFHNK